MLAVNAILRVLAIVAVLLSVAACDDDDEKKKPEYEVEIYYSEDVKIRWFPQSSETRGFEKPRIHVDHPKGVAATHDERPPRKKTVYDFAPVTMPALIVLLLAAALRSGCVHPPRPTLQV